jgi:maleate cis-trans isomerase
MFEDYMPKYKIGCLLPGHVIDNHPYEFYRLAPPQAMQVMIGVGLKEFSKGDVERVFKPLEAYLDQLMERGVQLVMQNGVPLPILMGMEAHDKMIAHMAKYTGLPATSTVLCVVQSAADLGARKVVIMNKWTPEMNKELGRFFGRVGVEVVGGATKPLHPTDFHKIDAAAHMQLGYELGVQAMTDNPDCDAGYIGGGSWIAEPVAAELEKKFNKPVLCNQSAVIRHTLKMLGGWQPMKGHSRLLALP